MTISSQVTTNNPNGTITTTYYDCNANKRYSHTRDINGILNGESIIFNSAGRPQLQVTYKNNKLHGPAKYFSREECVIFSHKNNNIHGSYILYDGGQQSLSSIFCDNYRIYEAVVDRFGIESVYELDGETGISYRNTHKFTSPHNHHEIKKMNGVIYGYEHKIDESCITSETYVMTPGLTRRTRIIIHNVKVYDISIKISSDIRNSTVSKQFDTYGFKTKW